MNMMIMFTFHTITMLRSKHLSLIIISRLKQNSKVLAKDERNIAQIGSGKAKDSTEAGLGAIFGVSLVNILLSQPLRFITNSNDKGDD